VQAELSGLGGTVLFVRADVGQPDAALHLVERMLAEFGRLDIAVNNAAADIRVAPTVDVTEDEFDTSVAVNLKGLWLCMKHEIAAMQRTGGGVIVNVASINGLSGTASASIYSATKHAVVGLTRSAVRETIAQGIRINAVCPGLTDTPFQHRPHHGLSAPAQAARGERPGASGSRRSFLWAGSRGPTRSRQAFAGCARSSRLTSSATRW
jgi:NAD(P)-dependent dehydrogenase (short-subunit alcohol dehydrogenase family)